MADDDELDWRNYRTHDEFAAALSKQLWERIKRISKETGLTPQAVTNRMIVGMYDESRRLRRQRLGRSN